MVLAYGSPSKLFKYICRMADKQSTWLTQRHVQDNKLISLEIVPRIAMWCSCETLTWRDAAKHIGPQQLRKFSKLSKLAVASQHVQCYHTLSSTKQSIPCKVKLFPNVLHKAKWHPIARYVHAILTIYPDTIKQAACIMSAYLSRSHMGPLRTDGEVLWQDPCHSTASDAESKPLTPHCTTIINIRCSSLHQSSTLFCMLFAWMNNVDIAYGDSKQAIAFQTPNTDRWSSITGGWCLSWGI